MPFFRFAFNLLLKNRSFIHKDIFRNYPAPRKRFYKNVFISESNGKFEVNLDKRKLKTPLGNLLQLPNEALATAVATEWDMQQQTLQQQNMHLTSLCNTAIDNPCHQTKHDLCDNILEYLISDTLCYRLTEPQDFVTLQSEKWDPVIKWFQNRYNVNIKICEDLNSLPAPKETLFTMRNQLISYNDWSLLGISFAAENLKSLILTMALINHHISVEMAVYLSRLEANFQIKRWGKIEWSHDIEKTQTTSRVAAAALFTYLNEGSTSIIEKNTENADFLIQAKI